MQLAYHPAFIKKDGRSALEDPLFTNGAPDSLEPGGTISPALHKRLTALRGRVRSAYEAALAVKVEAVIKQCVAWKVRVLVFPEYSIPATLLPSVLSWAGDMMVVAGSHSVDRVSRDWLRQFGGKKVTLRESVTPVLFNGLVVGAQAKMHPAKPEVRAMVAGEAWEPVGTPHDVPGPMGVLTCLDFLNRESAKYRELAAEKVAACRFLAVPSLTPHHTTGEFSAKAWEEARRYGRPVLYADGAEGGGSSIYVDEGRQIDLAKFPERAGLLVAGDEGVVVADVDLGFVRPGGSTRYDDGDTVVPFAEASFVYRTQEAGEVYAAWLEENGGLLASDGDEAVDALTAKIGASEIVLGNAGAMTGAKSRERRLARLSRDVERLYTVEEIRRLAREIVLPKGALPVEAVRAALAKGAGEALFDWLRDREARDAGCAEVESTLRAAADKFDSESLIKEARKGFDALALTVRGKLESDQRSPESTVVKPVVPEGMHLAALGAWSYEDLSFEVRARPEDFTGDTFEWHIPRILQPSLGRSQLIGPWTERTRVFDQTTIRFAADVVCLRMATGATQIATVSVRSRTNERMLAVVHRQDGQVIVTAGPSFVKEMRLKESFAAHGLDNVTIETITDDGIRTKARDLTSRFRAAQSVIENDRTERLKNLRGAFVEPNAGGDAPTSVFAALDAWLVGPAQTGLLLGEFGTGKSTVLAAWSSERWARRDSPAPILVNLARVAPSASAESMLLEAAEVKETDSNLAAMRLLIRRRLLLPLFDGFDEMATRIHANELPERLAKLLYVARGGGKVLVSSRDNYFPTQEHVASTVQSALAQSLGASVGVARIQLELLTRGQVEKLVEKVRGREEAASALVRIESIHDLGDLIRRPLFAGMVLPNLDTLSSAARAEIYENYLTRWLANTRKKVPDPEAFTDEQKKAFAEALAEQLWRSGEPSCTWQDLQATVRRRLFHELPDDLHPSAAFLEIQGGAFFVREGEDRYRFAHKSFLEYFLARSLVATLPLKPLEALATKPITHEVAGFVGEILKRQGGEIAQSPPVSAVRAFLGQERTVIAATAESAANALRFLLSLERWAERDGDYVPVGADIRGVVMPGEDLRNAVLMEARLDDADLCGCDLSGARLTGACLDRARVKDARLNRADLSRASLKGARFDGAAADDAKLVSADLSRAVLRFSMWTRCDWEGARLAGADVAATSILGRRPPAGVGARLPAGLMAEYVTGHSVTVTAIAWSPDGQVIASGSNDNTVRIWDAETGRERCRFLGHASTVTAVAWSPDGQWIVSGSADRTARIWDAMSGKEHAAILRHRSTVNDIAWSPNGQYVVSTADNIACVWDAASGKERARFSVDAVVITSVAWSPDGQSIAFGDDKSVRVWNAEARSERARLLGHSGVVTAVAWSRDGRSIVSASDDNSARIWDADTGEQRVCFAGHSAYLNDVAWSPAGTCVASASFDRTVRVWDANTALERVRFQGHTVSVLAIAWSPDGRFIASASGDQTACVWDADSGKERTRFRSSASRMTTVAWSPVGNCIAAGYFDRTERVWDVDSGLQRARFRGHLEEVTAIAWSPVAQDVVSVSQDRAAIVWDVDSGVERTRFQSDTGISDVAWSPDGRQITASCWGRTSHVWSVDSGAEVARRRHSDAVLTISWSPDGHAIALGSQDGSVSVWDYASGVERTRFQAHSGSVTDVTWSPSGQQVASASSDNSVKIWDADSGRERARLEGHEHTVTAVAWSPDGGRIASASWDGTMRVWSVDSGTEHGRFVGHSYAVTGVSWSADGKRVASASWDSIARVWCADSGKLLALFGHAGESTVVSTPGGFCVLDDREHLAVLGVRVSNNFVISLPLAGLREILNRPDRVRAALAGDLSNDYPNVELERLGLAGITSWSPERRVVAEALELTAAGIVNEDAVGAGSIANVQPNPFVPNTALHDSSAIITREDKLNEVTSLVRARSPVILLGHRRAGKTTLLALLEKRCPNHAVYSITLEGQALVTSDDLARVLAPDLLSHKPTAAFEQRFPRSSMAVFFLDEIAHLHQADGTLFAWLRKIGQHHASIVLAGTRLDWVTILRRAAKVAPGSSFGNDATEVHLGPVTHEEAVAFLLQHTPPDIGITEEVAGRIVEKTGAWPFYVVVMGWSLVEVVRAGNRRVLVNRDDLQELYEERVVNQHFAVFNGRFTELPPRVRRVLLENLDVRPIYRDLSKEDRIDLANAAIATATGTWLEDRPFFDWIRVNAPNLSAS